MKQEDKATRLGISVALLVGALMFSITGFLGVLTEDIQSFEVAYLIAGLVAIGIAGLGVVAFKFSSGVAPRSILKASMVSLVTFLFLSFLAFWMSGAFGRWDDILLEVISGVTATNLSVLENPETLERSVQFLRAFTQWVSGFAAFCFYGVLLPVSIRSRKSEDRGRQVGSAQILTSSTYRNFLSVLKVYLSLTGFIILGYLVVEMGVFDSVTHGFTTISTGGFSNYKAGLAHFNSAGVEWVAAFGMFFAGLRPALLVWLLRGSPGVAWRAVEVRVYVILTTAATLILWLGDGDGIRKSLFSVTSAISSTGFYLDNWGGFAFGLQIVLLLLIATGTMSGTAGGGFGLTRAIEVVSYTYRELIIQLHPKAIHKVKVGQQVIDEGNLSQTQSFQFFFLGFVVFGAVALAQFGADLTSAISGSITALATMGPGIGEFFADPTALAELPRPARLVLMALMLVGRVSVFPIMILIYRAWERSYSYIKFKVYE